MTRLLRLAAVFCLSGALLVALPRAQEPYRILVTNDDGVRAPGLQALAEALRTVGQVTVVAPSSNQSAKGTSLTTSDPIMRENLTLPGGLAAVGLSATPATTLRVALAHIVDAPPDLVVSGINRGTNMGLAAYISGTVGAAREAASRGVPAVAVSLTYAVAGDVASYAGAAEAALRVVSMVKSQGLPPGVLLNVNVPAGTMATFKGIRMTTQGTARGGAERFDVRQHPTSGRPYYWNVFVEGGTDVEGTDTWAVANGYVAVTPLRVGEFDPAAFEALGRALEPSAGARPSERRR